MKLSWQRREVHLRHPFNIARTQRDSVTSRQVLLASIEHRGVVGWGESAPSSYYRQSLDSGERVFEAAAGLLGSDPFAIQPVLERLWERFEGESAAIAAIDAALHDLAGKLLGVPVWRLLGLDPQRVPLTSFTIGIDDIEVIERKVAEAAGYPLLKIKVGTPQDEQILQAIRRGAPDKPLRVDANCGWTSANVMEMCRLMVRYGVEFVEQPTAPGDYQGLAGVRRAGVTPLIADESCVGYRDVLACAPHFDGINIKLSKCGGIRRALQMIHTARSAGMKVMLGCMVETSVGIAAAAQLAPLVDYLDLDGHLLLADDPFEGIGGQQGRITLSDRPGLGVVERRI